MRLGSPSQVKADYLPNTVVSPPTSIQKAGTTPTPALKSSPGSFNNKADALQTQKQLTSPEITAQVAQKSQGMEPQQLKDNAAANSMLFESLMSDMKLPTRPQSSISTNPLMMEAETAIAEARTSSVPGERNGRLNLALEMGMRLEQRGDLDGAKQILESVKEITGQFPDSALSHKTISLSRAIQGHGRLPGGDPRQMVLNDYMVGSKLHSAGKFAEAIEPLKRAMHNAGPLIDPDNVDMEIALIQEDAFNKLVDIGHKALDSGRPDVTSHLVDTLTHYASSMRLDELKNRLAPQPSSSLPLTSLSTTATLSPPTGASSSSVVISSLDKAASGLVEEFEAINKSGEGTGFAFDANRVTYPFKTSGYAKLTPQEKTQIAKATLHIQEAATQARNELISGDLAHFQGSGALGAWRRHATEDPPRPLTAKEAGTLIEYRANNILKTKLVSGQLEGLGLSFQYVVEGRGYQKARPDLALHTDKGNTAYIDFTAQSKSSVGHVLKKGDAVLTTGAFLAEATYPPTNAKDITYDIMNPPNRSLSPQQIIEINQRKKEIVTIKAELVELKKEIRTALNKVASTPDEFMGKLIDGRFMENPILWGGEEGQALTKKELEANNNDMIEAFHCLSGKPTLIGRHASQSQEQVEYSIERVASAIEYWRENPLYTKEKAATNPLYNALKTYETKLARIDELYSQI